MSTKRRQVSADFNLETVLDSLRHCEKTVCADSVSSPKMKEPAIQTLVRFRPQAIPPAGLEPAPLPPEGNALSSELWGPS